MEPVVATVADLYRAVHAKLREAVGGLDEAALNWVPAPEANSVAILVVHTLGSEAEVLRTVRGVPGERDRDAEFRTGEETEATLLRRLDDGDALLAEMTGAITPDDLTAERPRGERPPQTGLYWLLSNYGHAREHLAHIELTKQIYKGTQGDRS